MSGWGYTGVRRVSLTCGWVGEVTQVGGWVE